ncbi:hypothetical protein [Dysgonomonas sp. ZJ709]|uniref:DUF6956 domain-containing protein n=1 Tax=Dysgonomonas sp. ZJ709 TaxID=2709797 RepID=UPI0013ED9B99|nr:hypothetical protein [Dysgonomonas sp. ZJ709]
MIRILFLFGYYLKSKHSDFKYHTFIVTFSQSIKEIDKMFTHDYSSWQTVNLKEWVENYESSRFTQISDCKAVITSEYNTEHIAEWLAQHTPVRIIEHF